MSFNKLHHVIRQLPGGGEIIVLETGASIGPEAVAMLQALYSRSVEGFWHHIKILEDKGPEKFMSSFYVGYGHKSIGDCGNTVVFIEGVSMLAAKAIQDWMLYNGQEASTRFIDFATQPFGNPLGLPDSVNPQVPAREFYVSGMETVISHIMKQFPMQENENEKAWNKAVRARAFDVMRGFLPSGAQTKLSWSTNLRQASDALMFLRHHPLVEVRIVAEAIEGALNEAYPSSFGHKRYTETENYNAWWMENYYYLTDEDSTSHLDHARIVWNGVDTSVLDCFREVLSKRPPKTELPKKVGAAGNVRFEFKLDFGSFRDIQRQRSVIQMMPLVTHAHGFHEWYLDELPEKLRVRAENFLKDQESMLESINGTPEERQYYVPMGYKIPNVMTGDIPAFVYIVELRATRFVHPTLRARAKEMAGELTRLFGEYGLVIHLDPEPDRFDVRRGTQDIVMKE